MSITFTNTGGVGINVTYDVLRDGKRIAVIKRTHTRDVIGIYSHYGHKLWEGRGIDRAKLAAGEITYPTKEEIYATICADVLHWRRLTLELIHAHDLARLSREILAGSNTARCELEELLAKIEQKAADKEGDNGFYGGGVHAPGYPRKGE